MKHSERKLAMDVIEKAEEVVYLWLRFSDKNDKLDGISGMSPTMMGAVSDFLGEIPRGSDFKPETLGARVDRQRQIPITREERQARNAIMSLSIKDRLIVSIWPQLRRKENEATGELYTLKEVLALLRSYGVAFANQDEFLDSLEIVSERLVLIAQANGLQFED